MTEGGGGRGYRVTLNIQRSTFNIQHPTSKIEQRMEQRDAEREAISLSGILWQYNICLFVHFVGFCSKLFLGSSTEDHEDNEDSWLSRFRAFSTKTCG